jgi:hypothetical protein
MSQARFAFFSEPPSSTNIAALADMVTGAKEVQSNHGGVAVQGSARG